MWLLNVRTRRLEEFIDDRRVGTPYAILSHTWDQDEVSFYDVHQDYAESMAGYRKIDYTCKQASKNGIEYVWVDTCCIDKRSSAELSEAINSMYRWYYNAQVCYVYLEDVTPLAEHPSDGFEQATERWKMLLARSRWFTRGWTLQELIAPYRVEFYNRDWEHTGNKHEMTTVLSDITGIPSQVLRDRRRLSETSIAQRMAWASRRATSRTEDRAYCLLGLFDVNMPLMYGEGEKAFVRLQEEIIQTRSWEDLDHSILGFQSVDGNLLAASPEAFDGCHKLTRTTLAGDGIFEMSKRGLRISLLGSPIAPETKDRTDADADRESADLIVMLNCTMRGGTSRVGLRLRARPQVDISGHPALNADGDELIYDRLPGLIYLSTTDPVEYYRMDVTIARKAFSWPGLSRHLVIRCAQSLLYLGANDICDGTECGYSASCPKQYWTDKSGHHFAASDVVMRDMGRISMGCRSDGKFHAEFGVKSADCESAESSESGCSDIMVVVEAHNQTVPPVLRAYCCDATTYGLAEKACEKLRTLRVGSPSLFNINTRKDLQAITGLGFETGAGVWHLDLRQIGSGVYSNASAGFQTARLGPQDPQLSPPYQFAPKDWPSAPVSPSVTTDTLEIRAIQRELSNLRDRLSFLVQKSLHDNEDSIPRLETRPHTSQLLQSLLRLGKAIASAIRRWIGMEGNIPTLSDAGPSGLLDSSSEVSASRSIAVRTDEYYKPEAEPSYELEAIVPSSRLKDAATALIEEDFTVSVERFYETTSRNSAPPLQDSSEARNSSHDARSAEEEHFTIGMADSQSG